MSIWGTLYRALLGIAEPRPITRANGFQRPLTRRIALEPLEDRRLLAVAELLGTELLGDGDVGEIRGTKWNDLDGDGVWDQPQESGLEGWTIYLDENGNGQWDGVGVEDYYDVTDDDGSYVIAGVPPGNYTVAEVNQTEWKATNPGNGTLQFAGYRYDDEGGLGGFSGPASVAASPLGTHVYVAGLDDDAVAVFSRNASTGVLTFVEFQKDGIAGVDGLDNAASVAVSPDGESVYVAGSQDNAVAVFHRDPSTGELTFVECEKDGANGVDGLNRLRDVTVSPDGKHVYVAGGQDHALAVFARDPATGALTFVECQKDGVGGVDGLSGAVSVTVSPDGAYVYVAADGDSALSVFARDAGTGRVTFVEVHTDGASGVDGLNRPFSVTASPGGEHVYVAAIGDHSVAVFARNTSGELTFVEVIKDGIGAVDGLASAYDVVVSPDGGHVYVAGALDDAVAVFSRDGATGRLTFVEIQMNGVGSVAGLDYPAAVMVSPDSEHVYAGGLFSDSVAVFARDEASGQLSFVGAVEEVGGGVDGISEPRSTVVSPDGAHVYVAGYGEGAVAVFRRNAVTGELTFVGCEKDGADGVDGLDGVYHLAMSPDGSHVYAAGSADHAVAAFSRNATTGELTFVERVKDGVGGVDGILFPTSVTVSPDGMHVYVTGGADDAVAAFLRNATTGQLTFIECEKDGVNGVDGLSSASNVTVSPDGGHVYVTGQMDDAVAVFSRNATTGQLTFMAVQKNGVGGVDGLDGAFRVTLSPDGGYVYVTGQIDDAVAMFTRNATTGELTYLGLVKDGQSGVEGLNGAADVIVSPDGAQVYVAGLYDNAVATFSRDSLNGKLTFVEVQRNGAAGVDGIDGAYGLAMSPDGNHLYVASFYDNAVAAFRRQEADRQFVFVDDGAILTNIDFGSQDIVAPTADIIDVAPDPRVDSVDQVTIVFSEPVVNVDYTDFSLSRSGTVIALTAANNPVTTDGGVTWVMPALSDLTDLPGLYVLGLRSVNLDVEDLSGNPLAVPAVENWEFSVPSRLYVDLDAAAGGNGYSWATACNDLNLAVDAAADLLDLGVPGLEQVEIWIAEGTYLPTRCQASTDPRSATFTMHTDTTLVGGFAGTETAADQRLRDSVGLLIHETVLSGDLGVAGDLTDNAYTVVYAHSQVDLVLDGLTITGGYANGTGPTQYDTGGGLFVYGGSAIMNDVTFVDNSCIDYGGALRVSNASVAVQGSRFYNNRAFLQGTSQPRGGAINAYSATMEISNSIFESNSAYQRSGAVELSNSPATIEDSIFRGNVSGNSGAGAVCTMGSPVTFDRSVFVGNATSGDGGAAHVLNAGTFNDCTFFDNSATAGGALSSLGSYDVSVNQSVFIGNHASDSGGAIRSYSSVIRFSTITHNHARGGGGVRSDNSVSLVNTIVAGNTAYTATWGTDVNGYMSAAHSLVGDSSAWYNAADYVGLYGNVVGTAAAPLDPMFVRAPSDGGDGWGDDLATPGIDESANDDLGELHPQVGSPTVNAGQATTSPPAADFDGHPRVVHGVIDMGAYEYQNLAPLADASGPYGVASEGIVTLNAAASSDPDAPHDWIASYAWDFDGDGIFDDAAGVAPLFSAAGLAGPTSVSVAVRVTDSEGATHVDSATVYVFSAPVHLEGTAGRNTITVTPGSAVANIDHVVDINGTLYTYSALAVGEIHIDGLGGTDKIIIRGTDQDETAALQPGSVDVAGQTYRIHAANVETITVDGAVGNDTVTMTGSGGSNRLYSYTGYSTLTDSTRLFQHRVENFETVTVNVSSDGPNSAYLYDSSESDVLAVEPAFAELKRADDSTVRTASGFQRVYAYATEGAADTATLTGMPDTANRFYGYADYSLFTESRRSFYFYVRGFDTVTAISPGTGTAYGYLYDSPGTDAFTASTTSATMNRQDPWSDTIASGFTRIYAYSTRGGADTAELTGSAAGGNTYRGYPAYSTLYDASQSFYHYVRGFRSVTAIGSASDAAGDRAYLYDSVVADTFRGEGVSALLEDTAQQTYRMEALYFDRVYARSSDDAETEDTVEIIGRLAYNLIRWGTW